MKRSGPSAQRRCGLAEAALALGMATGLAATASAAPTPPGQRVVKDGVTCVTEMVPMRDGTRLYTEIYLPAGSESANPQKRPVVLVRSPYGATGLMEGCFVAPTGAKGLNPLGFVAVIQSVRGTGSSEGEFFPLVNERNDGIDLIEWAARQPWSNGKVGMTSGSYLGWTQWRAAPGAPASLLAITPSVSGGNPWEDAFLRDGVPDPMLQGWTQQFVGPAMRKQMTADGAPPEQIDLAVRNYLAKSQANKQWLDALPRSGTWDEETRRYVPFLWEMYRHQTYDAFWRGQNVDAQVNRIRVPVLVGASWYDFFTKGAIESYLALVARGGSPAVRRETRLTIDCCGHSPGFPMPKQPGEIDWGPNRLNANAVRDKFLLQHVAGKPSGLDDEARVQITVLVPPDNGLKGDTFIYKAPAWPVPGIRTLHYFLASGGKANTLNGDGVLAEETMSRGPADSFLFDPQNPVPSIGLGATGAILDQTPVESRPDVLVYTAPAERAERLIMGKIEFDFWAMTDGRDTDFTAKLVDVHPDGFAHILAERIVRGRFRKGSQRSPELLIAGRPYPFKLEMGYIASVLRPGHRLRLEVSSSNFPKYARNLNTGASNEDSAATRIAGNTLLHDTAHPAVVTIPFVPMPAKQVNP